MTIKVNSKKSKQGFTILELVVALGIILTMSVSAVSVIQVQNNIYRTTLYTTEATNMAENAIECFRFAVENKNDTDGLENINNSFKKAFALTVNIEEDALDLTNFQYNGLDVEIKISETSENSGKYVLSFVAKQNDKIVLEESYTK